MLDFGVLLMQKAPIKRKNAIYNCNLDHDSNLRDSTTRTLTNDKQLEHRLNSILICSMGYLVQNSVKRIIRNNVTVVKQHFTTSNQTGIFMNINITQKSYFRLSILKIFKHIKVVPNIIMLNSHHVFGIHHYLGF